MSRTTRGVWVIALLVLTACSDPVAGSNPGWLRASLAGTVAGSYVGSGDFLDQTDREEGPRRMFSLYSSTADLTSPQSFGLYRVNGNRPAVGRYELQLVDQSDSDAEGFFAIYSRSTESQVENFVAQSGEVVVTRSSRERLEGTFRFVGFRYCALPRLGSGQEGPCVPPAAPVEGAPTVEVTGSFSAVPFEEGDLLDMR